MKKQITLYNVIFPLWLVMFIPPILFITLAANFIIDAVVILLSMRKLKVKLPNKTKWKMIVLAWLLGFLADICGVLILFALQVLDMDIHNYYFVLLFIVVVAGLLIYWFDSMLFKKFGIPERQAKKMAIVMAIVTAPWTFFAEV